MATKSEFLGAGEVDLTAEGLRITVIACGICGALTAIDFRPEPIGGKPRDSVGLDNQEKHRDWHRRDDDWDWRDDD